MNLRFVICIVAAVGLMSLPALGADATPAATDVPAVPMDVGITDTAQNSLNPATFTDEVTQKVRAEVQKLEQNSTDPGTVQMVRTWLISQNPPTASVPYQQAYVNALNTAFLGALGQGDPAVNFRVNVGIVITNLSGSKEALGDTVIKLLQDKCPAVVLWGERAAESIFPRAMQNANSAFNAQGGMGSKMLDAVVKSVTTQPDAPMSGDVARAAFHAVNPRLWDVKLTPAPAPFGALIDANLAMLGTRISIYQNVGVPQDPMADTFTAYLLFTTNVWTIMTPTQQQSAVQDAVDLTSYMGQRAQKQAANQNQELVAALREQGQWIANLGTILQDNTVQAAGQAIKNLNATLQGKQIADACANAYTSLSGNPTISAWNPPLTAPVDLSAPTGAKSAAGTAGGTATSLAPQ
jgi:hypothetical protein